MTGPRASPSRDPLLTRVVLRAYPSRWRVRYGEEYAALLTDLTRNAPSRSRARLITDAFRGAIDAHLRQIRSSSSRDRLRASLAATLWATAAFALTAAWFGKMKEGRVPAVAASSDPAVAAAVGVLHAAVIVAGATLTACALPVAWNVIRQATAQRRGDLIRPLVIGPAAVAGWLACVLAIARPAGAPQAQPGPSTVHLVVIGLSGAVAALAAGWALIAVVRRVDLPLWVLRAEVAPMAILSACMAAAASAELSWGLAIRAAEEHFFHHGHGILAMSVATSWAGAVLTTAAITSVAAGATLRAARALRAPDCP